MTDDNEAACGQITKLTDKIEVLEHELECGKSSYLKYESQIKELNDRISFVTLERNELEERVGELALSVKVNEDDKAALEFSRQEEVNALHEQIEILERRYWMTPKML